MNKKSCMEKDFKVLLTRSLYQKDLDYIRDGVLKITGQEIKFLIPDGYSEQDILELISEADILLGPYFTKEILKKGSKLKLIQVPWTGLDTVNTALLMEKDIPKVPVCNSHSNARGVAELGLTLILDLIKKVSYHDRKMRKGDWNRKQTPLSLGSELFEDQTVLIYGYGHIGEKLTQLLNSLNIPVYALSRKKRNESSNSLLKFITEENLDQVLPKVNIIVVTLPLTTETKNIINDSFFERFNDPKYLIVLSRAEVVDENALWRALQTNKLSGFASDVWWKNPSRGESFSSVSEEFRFEDLENVILSPHRAGYQTNRLPHLEDVVLNISNVIENKPLINQIN